MKILIVAQARSGSTSLLKAISLSSKLGAVYEPFADNKRLKQDYDFIKNTDNIVVKIVDNWFYKVDEISDPIILFSFFDKVIGLTREDTAAGVNSFLIANHFNSWRKSQKDLEIKENEYEKIIRDNYKEKYEYNENIRKQIILFDILQFTYEGIFVNKKELPALEKYLGFGIENNMYREGEFVDFTYLNQYN